MSDRKLNIEKALLQEIASGKEMAFSELYAIWQPKLSSFIFKITKSREVTAEVVQDVFMKIWMTREGLVEVENFKSYLFVVSKNQAINAFKKTMRELKFFQQLDEKIHQEGFEMVDELEDTHLSLVDEAIDLLSPRQKEIFLLHRQNKLTYQEIASQLGIGKETVKTHLELAVKSITKHLKERISLIMILIEAFSRNF